MGNRSTVEDRETRPLMMQFTRFDPLPLILTDKNRIEYP